MTEAYLVYSKIVYVDEVSIINLEEVNEIVSNIWDNMNNVVGLKKTLCNKPQPKVFFELS